MSISFYLFCRETMQAVHVAEKSSQWDRGPVSGQAVGMFCAKHTGKILECSDGDHLGLEQYDLWTSAEEPARLVQAKTFAAWLKQVDGELRRCGKPISGPQNVDWFEMQFNAGIEAETVSLLFGGATVSKS